MKFTLLSSGLEKTLEAGSSFRERNLVSEKFFGFLDMSRENNIKNGHLTPFLMVSSHFQQSKISKISRQRVISYFCANFVINHTRNLRRKNLGFRQLPRKKKTFSNPAGHMTVDRRNFMMGLFDGLTLRFFLLLDPSVVEFWSSLRSFSHVTTICIFSACFLRSLLLFFPILSQVMKNISSP